MEAEKYQSLNNLIGWIEQCPSDEFRETFQKANGQSIEQAVEDNSDSLTIGDFIHDDD